jgi:hypothetical protein
MPGPGETSLLPDISKRFRRSAPAPAGPPSSSNSSAAAAAALAGGSPRWSGVT